MKNQIKIIYIFITFLVSSIEAIGKMTIENASIPICDSTHGLNLFSIRGYTTEEIYEDYLFNFFIEKVGEYHYSVNCSIPTNMNSTPPIPTDSIIEDSSESESTNPYDSDSDFTEIPSNQGRLLENNYPFDGTCQILNITKNLSSNDYQFIKEIGHGSYGHVYRCLNISTGNVYACKKFDKKLIKNKTRLKTEINLLRATDHPNIIKLYETFEDKQYIYLIMEECSVGELFQRLALNAKNNQLYTESYCLNTRLSFFIL